MAVGGRVERPSRPRARAANVVVPFPRVRGGDRLELARLVPSGRSLLLAFAILAAALGGYWIARTSSLFSVDEVAVVGATPEVSREVRKALRDDIGRSLLAVDVDRAESVVEALPTVRSASFDRAFPHTLRVVVIPERAVGVVRQGSDSWLVSDRGRVMRTIGRGAQARLPRIWVTRDVSLLPGSTVTGDLRAAVAAVAPVRESRLPGRIVAVRSDGELTLQLRSGLQVRLGDTIDVPLKLAVAARLMPMLGAEMRYLDVSVPERPVAGTNLDSQVEVEGSTSTTT